MFPVDTSVRFWDLRVPQRVNQLDPHLPVGGDNGLREVEGSKGASMREIRFKMKHIRPISVPFQGAMHFLRSSLSGGEYSRLRPTGSPCYL